MLESFCLGFIVGIATMCIFQINKSNIDKEMEEDKKDGFSRSKSKIKKIRK